MARDVQQPASIGLGNTFLGGTTAQGPHAWLVGRLNLLDTVDVEIGIGTWVSQGGASLTRVFDPFNLHGRYELRIADESAVTNGYAEQFVRNNSNVYQQTFFVSFWVKRYTGTTNTLSIELAHPTNGAETKVATATVGPNTRTFVWWVVTIDNANYDTFTDMKLKIHPQSATASTGQVAISDVRVHRVMGELTQLPRQPLTELDFQPRVLADGGAGLQFGPLPANVTDGVFAVADCDWTFADLVHMTSILQAVNTRGYLFFRPDAGSNFGFLSVRTADPFTPRYVARRMLGYSVQMRLQGVYPLYGPPSSTLILEHVNGLETATPVYVQATTTLE